MPAARLSYEHKVMLMRQLDAGMCELKDLPGMANIALRTAQRLRQTWLSNGHALPRSKHGHKQGRPREVPDNVIEAIEAIVLADPAVYVEEIKEDLEDLGIDFFSIRTYHRVLERLDLRRKAATRIAERQSETQRTEYLCRISQYTAEQLVFVDESGFDLRVTNRNIVRGRRGQRVRQKTVFGNRGKHYTLLPACSLSRPLFAIHITDEGVDGYQFFQWVSSRVIPEMNEFPGERSVLVADNASIHKFPELREMVEAAGCKLEFLPPYSPDYNPIEKAFGTIKQRIRHYARGQTDMVEMIKEACAAITKDHVWAWYRYSRYVASQTRPREGAETPQEAP